MCVRQLNTTCIAVKERALTRRTEWVGTGGGDMRGYGNKGAWAGE